MKEKTINFVHYTVNSCFVFQSICRPFVFVNITATEI